MQDISIVGLVKKLPSIKWGIFLGRIMQNKKTSDYLVKILPFQIFYSSIFVLGLQQQTNIRNKSQYFQWRRYLEKLENKLWGRKLQWLCIKVKVLKYYSKCLTFSWDLPLNQQNLIFHINIFGGFQNKKHLIILN